ncbi:MAG: nucleotidyl transferase AbiEii/AbiGii toxin family protein [Endomicrobia bacterium]|nr:nucleotidyl transferase AbiEii/AbiGii toxin family protein [Endomicrobiia bacterium]MCL2799231.1 nucleotidyl transferase AbiEii/AbiGii toxin family protein [Endomicrobiia bacterium]
MNGKVFDQMLSRYKIESNYDYINAVREVMQQIALAGLYRGGFFEKAAFYGGTCLRIFYKSERFSEDMDFSLLKYGDQFKLENYFVAVKSEFKALGREIIISKKDKQKETNIESAFLKGNTKIYDLKLGSEEMLKIKIEVDVNPPAGFDTEYKLLLLPFSFMTRCYVLPDLFAGKIHAFLFRGWKNRVKGRDWYDFEWYVRNSVPLNFNHFRLRAEQFSDKLNEKLTKGMLKDLLKDKINKTPIENVKKDMMPFIKNPKELEIWSTDYFIKLVDMINFL